MSQTEEKDSDFFRKINKVVHFFSRTKHGGFLFCSCDNTPLIGEITRVILERAEAKKLRIKVLPLPYEESERFFHEIKAAAKEKPGGIILSNLDVVIALTKDKIIKDINLARDILLGLKVPILFCVSSKNIGKFANQAQDLFLRRERGVIHFPDVPGIDKTDIKEWVDKVNSCGFRDLVDEKSQKLRLGLLESQLKEAEVKKYKPERIANEVVLDLIGKYLDILKVDKANELLKKYKSYFNLKNNEKSLMIIGRLYRCTFRFEEALELLLKVRRMQEKTGNKAGLIDTYHAIGLTYFLQGELDKALELYLKSMELLEQYEETVKSGVLLIKIGKIYAAKGNWDKAREYDSKAKEVFEKNEVPYVFGVFDDKEVKEAAAKLTKSSAPVSTRQGRRGH